MAHDLHTDEPLGQERCSRQSIRTPAARTDSACQARGGLDGQHHSQGAPRRHWGIKKNGPQSIGKSRGGWTTKIHMVAADARTAMTFSLSPGQAHDAPEGRKLLQRLGPAAEGPIHSDGPSIRGQRRASAHWSWGLRLLFLQSPPGSPHGNTTKSCTRGATRSSGCSGG